MTTQHTPLVTVDTGARNGGTSHSPTITKDVDVDVRAHVPAVDVTGLTTYNVVGNGLATSDVTGPVTDGHVDGRSVQSIRVRQIQTIPQK